MGAIGVQGSVFRLFCAVVTAQIPFPFDQSTYATPQYWELQL